VCPWNRVSSVQKSREYKSAYGTVSEYHDDPVREQPRRGNRSGGNYVERVTNDEREDEMEENLQ